MSGFLEGVARAAPSNCRILLVDDNAVNLDVLEDMLRRAGHCMIDTCVDPFKVRELYAQYKHDAVLLDIHMPGLSGLDVMEQMKVDFPDEYLPVVVLTADTAPDMRRKALNIGARDYITKPFDRAEVLLRVENILLVQQLRKRVASLELAASLHLDESAADFSDPDAAPCIDPPRPSEPATAPDEPTTR